MEHSQIRALAIALHGAGVFKTGEFRLKSGLISPVYLDLRLLVSYPQVLRLTVDVMAELIQDIAYDRLAAIPYAALPICTGLMLRLGRPMIYPRKEVKDYGMKRAIEGEYKEGEVAMLIDDLVTTAESKFEAMDPLVAAGLIIRDIAVVVDRQSGGAQALAARGVRLHAVLTLIDLLDILEEANKLDSHTRRRIDEWLAQ